MAKSSLEKWNIWNFEKKKKKLTETLNLTFDLFQEGKSIEEIAKKRNLKIQTIEYQIIELITLGFIDVFCFLDNDSYIDIKAKTEIFSSLKEIKNNVSKKISYFQIKCVLADLNRHP